MKEKKYALYGIGVVLISLIGISLAYFATQIVGKEKDISVNTKDLRIIFNNGDAITGENVVAEDNWSMTKTFSVENKSNSTYKYNIVIKDLINTFKTTGYLQYKITSTDGGYNMTSFEDVPKSSKAQDTVLAYSISIAEGVTQNYTITIQYPNDENADQSDDMGAELSGKLYISEGSYPSLAKLILRDNPTISERTDFNVINTADTTGTIYQTNETEDGSTVYYYSGNTTNNWVKFGKYQNDYVKYRGYLSSTSMYEEYNMYKEYNTMDECTSATSYNANCSEYKYASAGDDIYWRIIRTNEDGSIRLLYVGTSHDTTNGHIGKSQFNTASTVPLFIGYMYGTFGSLSSDRTNENSSAIKTYIDDWYQSNLLNNYDKYISKTAIYCNDRSVGSGTYSPTNNGAFNYGANTRMSNSTSNKTKTPTYKCGGDGKGGLFETTQAVEDKFSASTANGGNGQLTYPIALMTADELSFAGGVGGQKLSSPYTWYYTNSQGESVDESSWWTLSPLTGGYTNYVWIVGGSNMPGQMYSDDLASELVAVRPSLSLSSCVGIKSGYGTPESPYEIDYDNSCK